MKRILVCTDFSQPGNNASRYAALFAEKVDAELLVVHFAKRDTMLFSSLKNNPPGKIEDQQAAMSGLVNQLRAFAHNKVIISSEVKKNNFYNGLNIMCRTYSPDLVIMGSRGNSPHLGIFGSKAIYAGKNLKMPLIVVPAQYKYENIQRIGIATDLKKTVTDAVVTFKTMAHELNAAIHVLYAESTGETDERQFGEARKLVNLLGSGHDYHTISSNNVDDDVMDYLKKQQVQLLAVIPRKYAFLQSLFHPSHTKHFIRYSTIPVLVLRYQAARL